VASRFTELIGPGQRVDERIRIEKQSHFTQSVYSATRYVSTFASGPSVLTSSMASRQASRSG
jgi:hypothetical protein